MNGSEEQKIIVGSITGLFGIRGWIKVFSETDPRENIVSYRQWWLQKPGGSASRSSVGSSTASSSWRKIKVAEGRRQGKTIVARLDGIDSPELAQELIGLTVAVERSQMPSLPQGEYYWTDLIGHTVINRDESEMGVVDRLFSTGANDVLVVTRQGPEAEILIPWILDSVILEVDLATRCIRVDWDSDY